MKKILVVRCGALGDLVYATSVIDALRYEFGDDTVIDFVCASNSGSLLENDHRINRVFYLKYKKIPFWLNPDKKEIVKVSKTYKYDILVNFEYGKYFRDLLDKVQATHKIGATYDDIENMGKLNRGEIQKRFLKNIVSFENLKKSYPSVSVASSDNICKEFNLNCDYLVVSPSNSHIYKRGINYRAWDNNKWKQLIDRLSKQIQVVIVGAKHEEAFFENLQPYPSNTINLVGKNNIYQLCSVINGAKALVCTDSASGHIGASVNTPVFVLMGPNDTVVDSPYKTPLNKIDIISLSLDCSPCYKTDVMKTCKDNICMNNITVDMVLDRLKNYTKSPQ